MHNLHYSNSNRFVLDRQDFFLKILDNISMKMQINDILRNLRLENGLTQKELAEEIGSTSKNIWAYEKRQCFAAY